MTGVTVIVTTFNDGRFLPDALASVRAQSHPDVELIVSDDESTDPQTVAVLEQVAGDGVQVLRNPHGGLSANRNRALAVARGPYIVCLDADDQLDPHYLTQAAAVLDEHADVGIVAPDMVWFGDHSRHEPAEWDLGRQLSGNRLFAASMYRLAAARTLGGYAEDLPHHEDWDLWLGLIAQGWRVHLLGTPGLRRRSHGMQMSTGLNAQTNPPVFARIMRRHQGLYADHAEEFWAAVLAERDVLAHFKRRYGGVEDALHRLARRRPGWLRRPGGRGAGRRGD